MRNYCRNFNIFALAALLALLFPCSKAIAEEPDPAPEVEAAQASEEEKLEEDEGLSPDTLRILKAVRADKSSAMDERETKAAETRKKKKRGFFGLFGGKKDRNKKPLGIKDAIADPEMVELEREIEPEAVEELADIPETLPEIGPDTIAEAEPEILTEPEAEATDEIKPETAENLVDIPEALPEVDAETVAEAVPEIMAEPEAEATEDLADILDELPDEPVAVPEVDEALPEESVAAPEIDAETIAEAEPEIMAEPEAEAADDLADLLDDIPDEPVAVPEVDAETAAEAEAAEDLADILDDLPEEPVAVPEVDEVLPEEPVAVPEIDAETIAEAEPEIMAEPEAEAAEDLADLLDDLPEEPVAVPEVDLETPAEPESGAMAELEADYQAELKERELEPEAEAEVASAPEPDKMAQPEPVGTLEEEPGLPTSLSPDTLRVLEAVRRGEGYDLEALEEPKAKPKRKWKLFGLFGGKKDRRESTAEIDKSRTLTGTEPESIAEKVSPDLQDTMKPEMKITDKGIYDPKVDFEFMHLPISKKTGSDFPDARQPGIKPKVKGKRHYDPKVDHEFLYVPKKPPRL